MIDIEQTGERLEAHLRTLTDTIGERSVRFPENLKKTADYIQSFYEDIGIAVTQNPYITPIIKVDNVVAEISTGPQPSHRYLLGAHYDSVSGTVGADDNASAIAVQLETARGFKALLGQEHLDLAVTFVSFALEEPPARRYPLHGQPSLRNKGTQRTGGNRRDDLPGDGGLCLL